MIDDVLDGIDIHYYFVDDIMAADDLALVAGGGSYNTAYYNQLWQVTGEFTKVLFQEASEAVADGWYTAWVNAGSPIPVPEPAYWLLLTCAIAVLLVRARPRGGL